MKKKTKKDKPKYGLFSNVIYAYKTYGNMISFWCFRAY